MKLTAKQELFITEYMANNLNATEAYKKVYGCSNDDTARANASRLIANANVKKIIDEKLKEKAESNGITAEFVLNGIKAIAVKGQKETDKLKAFELLGKHLKLFTEKIESDNINNNFNKDISDLSDEELEKEIEKLEE